MISLNHWQERFCHSFVENGSASVAAKEAGYHRPTARQQGWRLLQEPRIQDRIGEIQATLARLNGQHREALAGKLEVVYRRAMQEYQFHAAVRAVELQARLAGFGVALRPPQPLTSDQAANDGETPRLALLPAPSPGAALK